MNGKTKKNKGAKMLFSTVKALVGWAFQMTEAVPVKIQKFAEVQPLEFAALSPDQLKMLAVDVMAKVGRLPREEQVVLAAYFTATTRAINEAAKLLPAGWPITLRRELGRGWADDQVLQRDQKDMAGAYLLSEPTMTRRKREAFGILSRHFNRGLDVLEVQLLDLVQNTNRFNAKRSKASNDPSCMSA